MVLRSNLKSALAAVIVLLASGIGFSLRAQADAPPVSLSTLYSFDSYNSSSQNTSGSSPVGLIGGPGGTFYGAAQSGGVSGDGTLFKVQSDGTGFRVLHSFGSSDGAAGNLVLGTGGLLYGTEPNGGTNSSGAVFSLAPDGSGFTSLYSFTATDDNGNNPDGVSPTGSLVQGSSGILYGETQFGGPSGEGGVYKINADGSGFTVLHSFGGSDSDGEYPAGGLIAGTDGTLYGVTEFGGNGDSGTVFKLNPDGSGYTLLYQFTDDSDQLVNADGAVPITALTLGNDGLLYGVTVVGGTGGTGTIFRIGTGGTGFMVMHAFSATDSQSDNSDGAFPNAALVKDKNGNFYGPTVAGGSSGLGTLYRLSADGSEFDTLYSFQSGDGTNPALVEGSDGGIYGTNIDGGANASGSLFRIDAGGTTHILWNNTNGQASVWNMADAHPDASCLVYGPFSGWKAVALADSPNSQTRMIWNNADGRVSVWNLSDPNPAASCLIYGPYAGWKAVGVTVGPDNAAHLLWDSASGQASLWNLSDPNPGATCVVYGPYAGWAGVSLSVGPNNAVRLLWDSTSGQMSLWNLSDPNPAASCLVYGPYAGWKTVGVTVGPDSVAHLLWDSTSGQVSLWNLSDPSPSAACLVYGPYNGWAGAGLSVGADNAVHLLWDSASGQVSLWNLSDPSPSATCLVYGPYNGWAGVGLSSGL
ncbi:MAG: choice-of-anchor tandem repeat GloVer-containing protein [Janthinobacterium lividum]